MKNIAAIRLLNQQLVSPQMDDPWQLIDYMGAVQAQEYRMMRWAIVMRTGRPSMEAFRKAYNEARIVRLHLMRSTWQLVTAEDYPWMRDLLAPKGIAVTRGWMKSQGMEIDEREISLVRDTFSRTAADKGNATKEDFYQALAEKDLFPDANKMGLYLRFAEYAGDLCSGILDPKTATYAYAPDRLKTKSSIERDEALLLFARKYFRSHQPATLEDFVWWSGLNISDCRRGMELMGTELLAEKMGERTFYLTDTCRTRGYRAGKYLLIPPYDEFLIGYKSRDVVLPPEFSYRAHDKKGIFYAVIAHDGKICGNWSPFSETGNIDFFEASDAERTLAEEWNYYRKITGLFK